MGAFIIACLSGFGIMNIPFQYHKKINKTQSKLTRNLFKKDLLFLLDQKRKTKSQMIHSLESQPQTDTKYLTRVKNFFSRSSSQNQLKSLKQDLKNCQIDYEQSYADYLEVNSEFTKVNTHRNHIKYTIQRYLAAVMIVLGIQRIVSTFITLVRGRSKGKTDIVVLIVSHSLKIFNVQLAKEEYQELVDNVYFAFFGILVLTNINGFLQNFFRFMNFIFKKNMGRFISSETILLFSAQVIGVYIMSSFYMIVYKISDHYTGMAYKSM